MMTLTSGPVRGEESESSRITPPSSDRAQQTAPTTLLRQVGVCSKTTESAKAITDIECREINVGRPTNGRPENRSFHPALPDIIYLSPNKQETCNGLRRRHFLV